MNATIFLNEYIGIPGIILLLLLTMLLYCVYLTRRTIEWVRNRADGLKRSLRGSDRSNADETAFTVNPIAGDETSEDMEPLQEDDNELDDEAYGAELGMSEESEDDSDEQTASKGKKEITMTISAGAKEQEAVGSIQEPYDPRLDLSNYKFPTLNLLKHYDNDSPAIDEKEQMANKDRIIHVLRNFGIEIDSINATVGPTITLYEITPAPGVRISKIRNLEADIALSLSALGIRIIAPIPGKGTIGIEVPNAKPVIVSIESILNSRKFAESKMELPVALGRTITNEVFMFDLVKMPHLLVSGATGQGKSVGLNVIITSLLYKKHPAEMKLVMVDPKMVEFNIYSPIVNHFLAKLPDAEEAIITDTTKVIHTLKSLCIEMDNRYELLKEANVRSIIEYNNLFKDRRLNPLKGHRYLPYIVVVIDEFGDLIMTAGRDIEMPIARIAQKARAVGIHMVIATQRPTTNIITGNIKANFPARMAFRVSSMIDSRTILDRPGANQLIGRGDMLFLSGSDPVRVQCAFVDTPEVNNICQYISRQQGYTDPYPLPEYVDENEGGTTSEGGIDTSRFDPIFADAARLIVVQQIGSTSLIQRKFAIGYNRAGRLMDQLERVGIVGKADGSKPRSVLVTDEVQLDRILENLNVQ
jgi:S-DNA-T family DNA segregation ATPase FtsK/SpoIIIE